MTLLKLQEYHFNHLCFANIVTKWPIFDGEEYLFPTSLWEDSGSTEIEITNTRLGRRVGAGRRFSNLLNIGYQTIEETKGRISWQAQQN